MELGDGDLLVQQQSGPLKRFFLSTDVWWQRSDYDAPKQVNLADLNSFFWNYTDHANSCRESTSNSS